MTSRVFIPVVVVDDFRGTAKRYSRYKTIQRDVMFVLFSTAWSTVAKMADSGALKKRLIRWMEDNRGLILTVVGLPASFMFDVVFQVSPFWT